MVNIELSHEQFMRLSAEARRQGKSAVGLARAQLEPFVDGLPPAEFQPADDDG
jgi:hypothetical protein